MDFFAVRSLSPSSKILLFKLNHKTIYPRTDRSETTCLSRFLLFIYLFIIVVNGKLQPVLSDNGRCSNSFISFIHLFYFAINHIRINQQYTRN